MERWNSEMWFALLYKSITERDDDDDDDDDDELYSCVDLFSWR